jgi:CxxC motif-containing protein (DUF1111 family)
MKAMKTLLLLLFVTVLVQIISSVYPRTASVAAATEAPAGFDNQPNGLTDQDSFNEDRETFDEIEEIADGLGPLYNAQSCGSCHQNPVSGGNSQVTELRAGHYDGASFIDHPGGSLINDRAIDATIQERVMPANEVRTFRMSTSTLGLGFVEAIDDNTLLEIARNQPMLSDGKIHGDAIRVPIVEAGNARRVGRFGWKCQHGSLVSFAADAYLNEMGITSPLQPTENSSNGESIAAYDVVPDPEDEGDDIEAFARFMRATKVPPRDADLAATPDALVGAQLFQQIGCAICHVSSYTTARTGAVINGGKFKIPAALGDKIIRPFSDFLLHDIGTGDGIVQNGGQSSRNKLRTTPLWGLRTRTRLMHDGESLTFEDAVSRHGGEAAAVIEEFKDLTASQRKKLLTFLRSL